MTLMAQAHERSGNRDLMGEMLALAVAVPEFGGLFHNLRNGPNEVVQSEIRVTFMC